MSNPYATLTEMVERERRRLCGGPKVEPVPEPVTGTMEELAVQVAAWRAYAAALECACFPLRPTDWQLTKINTTRTVLANLGAL